MSSSERYHWKFKLEALQPPLFRLSTTHDSLSRLSTRQILHRHTEISACPRNVKFRLFLFEARDRNCWIIRPRKKGKIKISTFFFLESYWWLKKGPFTRRTSDDKDMFGFLGVSDKVPGAKWFLLLRFEIIILGCVNSDIKTNNYVIIRQNHPKMNWLKLNSSSKGSCLINPGFKQKSFSFIQDENLKKPLLSKANRSSGQV